MIDFDSLATTTKAAPATGVSLKQQTMLDQLTDVGWLTGDAKEAAKARYLEKHGQYFDGDKRVIGL
jgi:hypothetical protein